MTTPDGARAYDAPTAVGLQAGRSDATGSARILDRGYRSYDGDRRGQWGAVRALAIQTMQRALGLRRSAGSKVAPFLSLALAYIPAIVFVGISVLASRQDIRGAGQIRSFLPTYGEYYSFVSIAILVFVAFVAPEVLCTDRKYGMLGLYLASPLSRMTYLLGKALGVLAILALVTLGPPLLFLLANVINGTGPAGVDKFFDVLWRMLLSGLAVALLHTALSLAIASVTTRRAVAAAGVILVVLSSSVFAGILVRQGGQSYNLFVLDLFGLPLELVLRIYGGAQSVSPRARPVTTPAIVGAYVAWTLAFTSFVVVRYKRLSITR